MKCVKWERDRVPWECPHQGLKWTLLYMSRPSISPKSPLVQFLKRVSKAGPEWNLWALAIHIIFQHFSMHSICSSHDTFSCPPSHVLAWLFVCTYITTRKISRVYPEFLGVSHDFPYFPGIFLCFPGISHAFPGFIMLSKGFWGCLEDWVNVDHALCSCSPLPNDHNMAFPHHTLCSPGTPIMPYAHLHLCTIFTRHSSFTTPYDFLSMRAP